VTPIDNKAGIHSPPPPTSYGNMPLAVSQSGSAPNTNDPEQKSKFEQNGKKFGKKLGNAGVFPVYCFVLSRRSDHSCSNFRCWCHCRFQHREQYFLNSRSILLVLCDLISLEISCLTHISPGSHWNGVGGICFLWMDYSLLNTKSILQLMTHFFAMKIVKLVLALLLIVVEQ
jgi:hypothetical protein